MITWVIASPVGVWASGIPSENAGLALLRDALSYPGEYDLEDGEEFTRREVEVKFESPEFDSPECWCLYVDGELELTLWSEKRCDCCGMVPDPYFRYRGI